MLRGLVERAVLACKISVALTEGTTSLDSLFMVVSTCPFSCLYHPIVNNTEEKDFGPGVQLRAASGSSQLFSNTVTLIMG